MPEGDQELRRDAKSSAYPRGAAFIDGTFRDMSEAKISVLDWGFLRSDATYDVVHVWKGYFFRLDKHLKRFRASTEKLRLRLPYSDLEITEILRQCVIRAGLDDGAYVEMILTRGHSPTFSRDPRDAINNFIAFAVPFGWIANEEQRARGLNIAISSVVRIPPDSIDPAIKNYHWLDLIAGLFEAYDHDCENVVLVDGSGNFTEGPGFNLFTVLDGRVFTPGQGILQGITRQTALDLCQELKVETVVGTLPTTSVKSADEVFITSTAGGVIPVTRINGEPVGSGEPGPMTKRLTKLYWEKHSDPAWTTPLRT